MDPTSQCSELPKKVIHPWNVRFSWQFEAKLSRKDPFFFDPTFQTEVKLVGMSDQKRGISLFFGLVGFFKKNSPILKKKGLRIRSAVPPPPLEWVGPQKSGTNQAPSSIEVSTGDPSHPLALTRTPQKTFLASDPTVPENPGTPHALRNLAIPLSGRCSVN